MNEEQKRFAITAEQRIDQARNEAVRTAIRMMLLGTQTALADATNLMVSSVHYQARLAGCGV